MNKTHSRAPFTYLSFVSIISVLGGAGCTSFKPAPEQELKYRIPATELLPVENTRYLKDIHPIFSNRCVVCHACVDAPCQLHLDSYPGVRRGATSSRMGTNIFESSPTRDKDARTTTEWRSKGFFPVINEISPDPKDPIDHLKNSILYQLIEQGFEHNQSGFGLDELNDHRAEKNTCPQTPLHTKKFIENHPAAGMPYGLPALDPLSFETLRNWIAEGAPGPTTEEAYRLTEPSNPDILNEWETFFNETLKSRLTARFIYEHAFMAHIHFEGTPDDEFFELVRSRTPFPETIDEIVTPRPYDSPGTSKKGRPISVYYRFKKVTQTLVRKTHILWELGPSQLLFLKMLFIETLWNPEGDLNLTDPGYHSTNPFEYFQQIPAEIRYRFMIENSRLIVNSMIRGPVCSGRIATNAIRDHFWVFFLDPAADVTVREPTIGLYEWAPLGSKFPWDLPAASKNYNQAMRHYKKEGFSLADIWKGEGHNPNAILTVLRHETSATVHYGPQGGLPGTVWVLNFSNFERIYYNLVVDFKPWGSEIHKIATWNSMSSHRAEAEERFISLLPKKYRSQVRSQWTHGLGGIFENHSKKKYSDGIPAKIPVDPESPFESLLSQLLETMPSPILGNSPMLATFEKTSDELPAHISTIEDWEKALSALSQKKNILFAQFLPNILFIRLENQPYTFISNRSYAFNNIVTLGPLAYEPEKDTVATFRGLFGDRPELFIDLSLERADSFIKDLLLIHTQNDWIHFKETYGIRRNNSIFWQTLDWFHSWAHQNSPLEAGVFDVSEYDIN